MMTHVIQEVKKMKRLKKSQKKLRSEAEMLGIPWETFPYLDGDLYREVKGGDGSPKSLKKKTLGELRKLKKTKQKVNQC